MSSRQWYAVSAIAAALLVGGCESGQSVDAAPTNSSSKATTTVRASTPAAPVLNRRGENGAVVQQDGLVGAGKLDIVNGNSDDFAVVVTNGDPKKPQATIYVQGNSSATLNGIDGTYYVYLKTGKDWDEATLAFTREREFQKFDDQFDGDSDWEITLQPSIGGNASTSDVPSF
ncbi:hypothetical protein [Nocardia salmonicida]|uniref:Lipoprotein n=1 Tax=Nocardia salmonicida TaxID=53431 RepID=A0ABZ1N3S8_9NOCA|nr:hypothetical protein [Nocardia salmonicida]